MTKFVSAMGARGAHDAPGKFDSAVLPDGKTAVLRMGDFECPLCAAAALATAALGIATQHLANCEDDLALAKAAMAPAIASGERVTLVPSSQVDADFFACGLLMLAFNRVSAGRFNPAKLTVGVGVFGSGEVVEPNKDPGHPLLNPDAVNGLWLEIDIEKFSAADPLRAPPTTPSVPTVPTPPGEQ